MIILALLWLLSGSSLAGDTSLPAGNPRPDLFAELDSLLQAVVTPEGLVRYDLLRGSQNARLERVLTHFENFEAESLDTQDKKLAFWINAYNVRMLEHVVNAPLVRHILDDGYAEAFFETPVRVADLDLTLNEIEHVILRRQQGRPDLEALAVSHVEPRIHVAINCAAMSCPVLQREAFRAERIDVQLDEAMRQFVNSPRHFRRSGRKWRLSSILDWFGEDFEQSGSMGDYLLRYVSPENANARALTDLLKGRSIEQLRRDPNIEFYYDWSLNAASGR